MRLYSLHATDNSIPRILRAWYERGANCSSPAAEMYLFGKMCARKSDGMEMLFFLCFSPLNRGKDAKEWKERNSKLDACCFCYCDNSG